LLGRTKLLDELADRIFTVGDCAQAPHFAIGRSYRYGYRLGMDIQTQES
jgi:hypothetical protein